MTKDTTLVDKLIQSRALSTKEICEVTGYSRATIDRRIKTLGAGKGRGVKHFWQYDKMTPDLAYVIGSYITDGCIAKSPYDKTKNRGVILSVTSLPFADEFATSLLQCGLPISRSSYKPPQINHQVKYNVACYSKMFADWLYEACDHKSRIPQEIIYADQDCQLAFVAGALDGDGTVGKSGCINIRTTTNWIKDLPELLKNLGIRNNLRTHTSPSFPRPYHCVSIRRSNYVSVGGYCIIPEKLDRMHNAKDERIFRTRNPKSYKCPICGMDNIKNRNAKRCRDCYQKSEQFYNHLVSIAKKGNIAGNIARWGNKNTHP